MSLRKMCQPILTTSNTINGILTHQNAARNIGVSSEVFEKITAVIVYTEALEGLMFLDFRNVWQCNGREQRFRMWVLDDKLRNAEKTRQSDILYQITGMKPSNELMLSGKLNDAPSGRLFRADLEFLQRCPSL